MSRLIAKTQCLPHRATKIQFVEFSSAITNWFERVRYRRQLGSLPDYLLKDMGITREQVWNETRKPFWKR